MKLDDLTWDANTVNSYDMNSGDSVFIRMKESDTGFGWTLDDTIEWKCAELITKEQEFTTTWRQWHVKALTTDADCTQDVLLKDTNGNVNNIALIVKQGKCAPPAEACAADMIQNLDMSSCKCEPFPKSEEKVVVLSEDLVQHYSMNVGDKATIREFA